MKLACASLTTVVFFSPGLAAEDAVDLDGALGGRAEVELVCRRLVVRDRTRLTQHLGPGGLQLPARTLLVGDGRDADPQGVGHAAARGRIPPSVVVSAWIAFRAALPYIPECRSRSPVRTRRLKAARPRVAIESAGRFRFSMPPSKMTHASAPRSSCSRNWTIDWPPTSSSPSETTRMLIGSAPSAASRPAACSSIQSWPLSSATPRA